MNLLVDTSVFCGHWPFRSVGGATPAELKALLSASGVTQAWVAPLEGLFYWDSMEANEALAEALQGDPFFLPVAWINVSLPTWRKDARESLERLHGRAFKLAPNYHQYELSDLRVLELAGLAREANVPVCVQLRMQDERGHHPLVKVPGVPAEAVATLAGKAIATRFLACGAYLKELKALRSAANVWAELSFAEWELALRKALEAFPVERMVFGSHSPLHYTGAEAAKLDVSAEDIPPEQVAAVRELNAKALLTGK